MAISSTQIFHSLRHPNASLSTNSSSSNARTFLASVRVSLGFSRRLKSGFQLPSTQFRALAMVKDGGEKMEDRTLIDDSTDAFKSQVIASFHLVFPVLTNRHFQR